ncbi:MAG: DUF58 domain-containing protein [Lachnospiraceae bacterium]|nr:DUF58 domain-containing protein [Lachnospiraceae bacterium]
MIPFILVGLAAVILILQTVLTPKALGRLICRDFFDMPLAEPDEKILYTGKLINNWFLPVVYINYVTYLPEGTRIEGQSANRDGHRLFLMPHRSYSHTVAFSASKRGVYRKGRHYVEIGDFLGLKTLLRSDPLKVDITVMPRRCRDEAIIRTLGGYLGDISVRRFILEDPVLTIGHLDYTGREPMNKISWKQSARVGQLMVKNNDHTMEVNAAVILNQASGSEAEKEKSFEIVRSVCEQLEEMKIPYSFLSNGDAGNLDEGFGERHFRALMTNLGRSRLTGFYSFENLTDRCCLLGKKTNRSYFFISPPLSAKDREALSPLQQMAGADLIVLEAEVEQDAVN